MSRFAVYKPSGAVIRVIEVPDSMDKHQGDALMAGEQITVIPRWAGLDNVCVSNGVVVERQPLNLPTPLTVIADGQDEAVISPVPASVSVTCQGETYDVTDGSVAFSTDMPGTYRLRFTGVQYLDQEVVIEASHAA